MERRVAQTEAVELRRDWFALSLGTGRMVGLEACGELVGLVWQGEGRVDVGDPGPERGHILHNLFDNLPGENELDGLVLIGSDGAVAELLAQTAAPEGATIGPWVEAPVPPALRAMATARLAAFDPMRQSGRDAHPPGEILWAPSPELGGLFVDLRLLGMTRQRKNGLEVTSPWLAYERTTGAGFLPTSPVRWRRRSVGSARALLLADLPTVATMAVDSNPFAEERAAYPWDLQEADVSLLVEPTFGLDKDLSSVDIVTTLTLRASEPTRNLTLSLAEGRQRSYAPSWAEALLSGVGHVRGEDVTAAIWSRIGDRIFVHFEDEVAPDELVTVRLRHKGQLIEPDGTSAITPLAGWDWYPRTPAVDRHEFELVAVMPRFWRAAATGKQVEEEDDGKHRRIVSRAASPVVRGDVFLVDADAKTHAPPRAGLPVVRVYRSPNTPALNVASLADDVYVRLEQLEALLGPCPWGEIDVVERGVNSYGLESPGVVPLGRADAPPEQSITSRSGRHTLLGALAGQWLGANMTTRSDHDRWLVEGLTAWAECFALEAAGRSGRCGALIKVHHQALENALNDVESMGPTTADWPVGAIWLGASSGWTTANQWHRAPLVLHLLRTLIGDTASRELLKQIVSSYGGQGLTTASFVLRAQSEAGQDLRRFFYGWVYATPQEPTARVEWSTVKASDGTWDLTLTGRLDDGRADTDPLPLLAPMLLRMKVGKQTPWQRLILTEASNSLTLRGIPEEPRALKLDPGRTFPGKVELKKR